MKTVVSLLVGGLIAVGLMTVASPAQAAYPKSISTACFAAPTATPISNTTRPRIRFVAKPTAGNGTPTGTVRIRFWKKDGTLARETFRHYDGGRAYFTFKPFKHDARYRVVTVFRTASTSVFKGCSDITFLTVR